MKLRKIFLAISGILLVSISGCSKSEGKITTEEQISVQEGEVITLPDGTAVNPDGTMNLALGSYSYILHDTSGNSVQNGDILSVENDLISGTVSFRQNSPKEKTEYALIVLVDYEKKSFSVGRQMYSEYLFTLDNEDSIDIDIELALPDHAKILTYLIVYEPQLANLTFEAEGRGEFLETHYFYTASCYLDKYQYDETDYDFCDNLNAYPDNRAGIFMTKDLTEMMVMPTCSSGDTVKIQLGNMHNYETTYIMLAFLDWEQSPIEGETYKLFKLSADEGYYYDLTIPEVKDASPYQIFVLENPFHPSLRDIPSGTLRTIVNPK